MAWCFAEPERGTEPERQIFLVGSQSSDSGRNLLGIQPTNNLKASSSSSGGLLNFTCHFVQVAGATRQGHSHVASLQRKLGGGAEMRYVQREEVSWSSGLDPGASQPPVSSVRNWRPRWEDKNWYCEKHQREQSPLSPGSVNVQNREPTVLRPKTSTAPW